MTFSIDKWDQSFAELVKRLDNMEFSYPNTGSTITYRLSNSSSNMMDMLPSQMKQFYKKYETVGLPFLYIGYWFASLSGITKWLDDETAPNRITGGDYEGPILMFGTDGGGGVFVIELKDDGQVLYLPDFGGVSKGVYEADFDPVCNIGSFFNFLETLLQDLEAFVNKKEGYVYIPDCWKSNDQPKS